MSPRLILDLEPGPTGRHAVALQTASRTVCSSLPAAGRMKSLVALAEEWARGELEDMKMATSDIRPGGFW